MINSDLLRERLRERVMEREHDDQFCGNCLAQLTEADYQAGECTQCAAVIMDDESVDEHLYDD